MLPILILFNVRDPVVITSVMLLQSIGIILPVNILWPLMLEAIPGGRKEMLIQVKLGIPPAGEGGGSSDKKAQVPMEVDPLEVAKVFPYGRLLPIEIVLGGLSFSTGRLVPELGDSNDMAVCVAACVSIGYNSNNRSQTAEGDDSARNATTTNTTTSSHTVYSTLDGL